MSEFKKGQIILLKQQGKANKQIADELGTTIKTVRKWCLRYEDEGEDGMKPRAKSGRRRTTTREQDNAAVDVSIF